MTSCCGLAYAHPFALHVSAVTLHLLPVFCQVHDRAAPPTKPLPPDPAHPPPLQVTSAHLMVFSCVHVTPQAAAHLTRLPLNLHFLTAHFISIKQRPAPPTKPLPPDPDSQVQVCHLCVLCRVPSVQWGESAVGSVSRSPKPLKLI